MSTIDPRVARAEKAARAQASGGIKSLAVFAGLVHAGLWLLAGYGIASVLDTFRLMQINEVGAWDSPHDDQIWMLFVGVFIGSFGGFALSVFVRGVFPRVAVGAPFVTGMLGLALGFILFFPAWTPPQRVGSVEGFLDGDPSTSWGPLEWIAYAEPWWLPAIFILAFLVALLLVVRLGRAATARESRIRTMIATGTRVVGTVSEALSGTVYVNSLPLVTLTVQYRDAEGTDRWVTKRRPFPPTAVPRVGDVYTVWYDPRDAGNQKRIVLAPGDVTGNVTADSGASAEPL